MELYREPVEGEMGDLCGWGTSKKDDEIDISFGEAGYENYLLCMPVLLWNSAKCGEAISVGNYEEDLICGQALMKGQKMTFVSKLNLCIRKTSLLKLFGISLHFYNTNAM